MTTIDRVRRILVRRRDVVEKRMVGGLSFSANGSMFCGVVGEDLMVRVGRDAIDRALREPHVRPMKLGGKQLRGFVLVEPGGFRTHATLAAWIQQGIDFVATLSDPSEPRRSAAAPRRSRSSASGRRLRRS